MVVFLLGIYLTFEMAGLTNIAITIISGTGLLGIILGIAFRDLAENFLASILLSIQHPFQTGDLIEIGGVEGFVERLTMRMTLLMTLNGNHVQIPNAIVYKTNIRNYTSNPNRREDFFIGISLDAPISKAQEIALQVLEKHDAVLKDPEPLVLVDNLGKSTINLRIYFWMNGAQHSPIKVKSSIIRLIKQAFQEGNIAIPDESREVIFPKGVAIQIMEAKPTTLPPPPPKESKKEATTSESEGLKSEAKEIKEQAEKARPPEEGKDLL